MSNVADCVDQGLVSSASFVGNWPGQPIDIARSDILAVGDDAAQLLQALGGVRRTEWDRASLDALCHLAEWTSHAQRLPAREAEAFGRAVGDPSRGELLLVRGETVVIAHGSDSAISASA
jgi:hypothetical protein